MMPLSPPGKLVLIQEAMSASSASLLAGLGHTCTKQAGGQAGRQSLVLL